MTTLRRPAALAATITLGSLVALLGPANATSADPPEPASRADVRVTVDDAGSRGRVISPRAACERGRDVLVVRRSEGFYTTVGSTSSRRDGRWNATPPRGGGPYTQFALVPGDRTCRVAQSRTIGFFRQGARPARVTITLQADAAGTRRGRVTSARPACERRVDVLLLGRSRASDPWTLNGYATTDDRGRYRVTNDGRRLGGSYQRAAVAIGTDRCAVAQSSTETVSRR